MEEMKNALSRADNSSGDPLVLGPDKNLPTTEVCDD